MRKINIFYSYSHKDEEYRNELEKHLAILHRQQVISAWHDRRISAGTEWEKAIDKHLDTADIVLLLISSDFLASSYCYDIEVSKALERHKKGQTYVVPILLRPVDWESTKFAKFQALPTDARPVSTWDNRDEAFLDIARGIRNLVDEIGGNKVLKNRGTPGSPKPILDEQPQLIRQIIPPSPYRGLYPFEEEHSKFFFGRDRAVNKIYEALKNVDYCAVMGPSGSGKSSLVYAGLLPRLRENEKNIILKIRPKNEPFQSLSNAILDELEETRLTLDRTKKAQQLSSELIKNNNKFNEITRNILKEDEHKSQIILIIDQFEEVFSLCKDDKVRESFIQLLFEQIEDVKILLTIRVDFLAKALQIRSFSERFQDNMHTLVPLYPEEIIKVIKLPAELYQVSFEQGLVERIIGEIESSKISGSLPLLEFALTLLWEEQTDQVLTHEAYDQIGGVRGALIKHAEEWYKNLDPNDKNRLKTVMFKLIRPVEGMDYTRRIATYHEFEEDQRSLVQKLISARLVMTDQGETDNGQFEETGTVEIVHEALINGWDRLQKWLLEERSFLLWKEQMRVVLTTNKDPATITIPPHWIEESVKWLNERPNEISQKEKIVIANTRRDIQAQNLQREKLKLESSRFSKGHDTFSINKILNKISESFLPGRGKKMLSGAFSHYVPQNIVESIIENPEKLTLGGEIRYLTVLFFDVDNLTSFSEQLLPQELIMLVNEYLTIVSDILFQYDGIIDRFFNGSIKSEFGIPLAYDDHALKSCLAAIEIRNQLNASNPERRRRNHPVLNTRIGISSGEMIVGNMGSRNIFDYSVMGTFANLADRLSSANKIYGSNILINENTFKDVQNDIVTRRIDTIRVKGNSTPMNVYEVISRKEDKIPEQLEQILFLFEKGFQEYLQQNWQEAEKYFAKCLEIDKSDALSLIYLNRIKMFQANPPAEEWDGVYTMTVR